MAKDKEIIVVEYDIQTKGAEKAKKAIRGVRDEATSLDKMKSIGSKRRDSEFQNIVKEMSLDKERARKALYMEKNLSNQRVLLARKTAKRVIKAYSGSAMYGQEDISLPRIAKSIESMKLSRKKTRYQKGLEKSKMIESYRNKFDKSFKVGSFRMMQGAQYGKYDIGPKPSMPRVVDNEVAENIRKNISEQRKARTARSKAMSKAPIVSDRGIAIERAMQERDSTRARVMANIEKSRRARESSKFGGRAVYGADYQQRQMQGASMEWMKSKSIWTPEKQKKMSKYLEQEAKAKEKVAKANEKIKKTDKTQSRKSPGMAKAMERTMLYAGFGMMASYMLRGAITSGLAVGDAFAGVEMDQRKGSALRKMYGGREEDAVKRYSQLTGEGNYMSRSILAQIASPLSAQGKGLSAKSLSGVSEVLFGMQYGMGKTKETAVSGLINVLSGKGTLKEAGFAGVKKGRSAEETLDNILKFLKTNELTKAIMQERSITASMGRVKSAPKSMLADMLTRAPEQMNRAFESLAVSSERFFDQEHWGRTMANFEKFSKALEDNAEGIGKFTAKITGIGLKAMTDVVNDPKGTLLPAGSTYGGYKLARGLGAGSLKTASKFLTLSTFGGFLLNSTETGMSADLPQGQTSPFPQLDMNSLRKSNSVNSFGQPIYIENAYFDENGQISQDIRHWGGQ